MIAAYIRVSTREQLDGYGLDVQREQIIKYLLANDYDLNVVEFFEDGGYSANSIDRPEYKRLVKRIKNKDVTTLIIYKLDRLFRNLRHQLEMFDLFDEFDVKTICITEDIDRETANGKMFFSLKGAMAEWERDQTKERAMDGQIQSAMEGNYAKSGAPFGYDKINKKLILNEDSYLVKLCFELLDKGMTYFEVGSILSEKKQGKSFTEPVIRKIRSNKIYYGAFELYDVILDNHSPAIISKDLFDRVNANPQYVVNKSHIYIFLGLVYDNETKRKMRSGSGTSSTGKVNYYYITKQTKKYLNENVLIEALNLIYSTRFVYEEKNKNFLNNIKKLETKKENAIKLFIDGDISELTFQQIANEIDYQLTVYKTKGMSIIENSAMPLIDKEDGKFNIVLISDLIEKIYYSWKDKRLVFHFKKGMTYSYDIDTKKIIHQTYHRINN